MSLITTFFFALAPTITPPTLQSTACLAERASRTPTGGAANANSILDDLSDDGQTVLIYSDASNLVSGDSNSNSDLFVLDRLTGQMRLVPVTAAGIQSNGATSSGALSGDGKCVSFLSFGNNLVPNDLNGTRDVFWKNLVTGELACVSVTPNGATGDRSSSFSACSRDGRYVAFISSAGNLVSMPGNFIDQCFRRDMLTGTTILLTPNAGGTAPSNGTCSSVAISGDGRYVAFASDADDLVLPPVASLFTQIWLCDTLTGALTLVSPATNGTPANGSCGFPSISADGRKVAFDSRATNLALGPHAIQSVFLFDVATSSVIRVSNSISGGAGDGMSYEPSLSGDGDSVVYLSTSVTLLPGDPATDADAFFDRLDQPARLLVSALPNCSFIPFAATLSTEVSFSGRYAAFTNSSDFLSPDVPINGRRNVFIRDMNPDEGVYCTTQVTPGGCVAEIRSVGLPSSLSGDRFLVQGSGFRSSTSGLLFYSVSGAASQPIGAGVACVAAPRRRTSTQPTGGSSTVPCSGAMTFDFNALIQSGLDPALGAGTEVWCQYWARDASIPAPASGQFSRGLNFTIR